jgi:hypothetical protein
MINYHIPSLSIVSLAILAITQMSSKEKSFSREKINARFTRSVPYDFPL